MDLRTVVTISALFLVTAGANSTVILSDNQSNVTGKGCNCSSSAPSPTAPSTSSPSSFAPVLGLLTIRWWSKCEGVVNLIPYRLSNSSLPVCHKSETTIKSLLRNVCENREGCKNTLGLIRGKNTHGYFITERGAEEMSSCNTLRVQCSVVVLPDVQGELRTYKVVTAVLCCVLLVLLLIRFTRPTVNALQKRLSDRRQNRWIGPTQSHSVSYHRGKTAVKNNDGEKRMSFPALERLTVSDSREPSSNRNSDYNF